MSPDPMSLPGFRSLLVGFGRREIETSEGAVYGLWPDLTLAYLNPAWFEFAARNGGESIPDRWGLGASVVDACGRALRGFYRKHFEATLESGQPWRHDYPCPSPTVKRLFHMDVFPLGPEGDRRGLLVVNTLFANEPYHRDGSVPAPPEAARYVQLDGNVLQCSRCRRIERADRLGHWDWVPEWVEDPPKNVTGGLCKPCYRVHYPSAPVG